MAHDVQAKPAQCAIYTRKSADVSEDEEVNSLQTQREVCSAYIRCQSHLGWQEVPTSYDDAGWSGGNLERPALQRLIADIESGRIQTVVFYKIDRLTRSLADFIRLADRMRGSEVSFVSVTQAFDTSTSMGRMILNILLTFAQFEREMLSDRIKDKFRSMRQQGLHVQGRIPLGYDKQNGRLTVNEVEAATVRRIFEESISFPNLLALERHLRLQGVKSKEVRTRRGSLTGGTPITRGVLGHLLRNPVYTGMIRCEEQIYQGAHKPIIDAFLWQTVQDHLDDRACSARVKLIGGRLLQGLLEDEYGRKLHLREGGNPRSRIRYYQSAPKSQQARHCVDLIRVRSDQVESLAASMIAAFITSPHQVRRFLLSRGFHRCLLEEAQSAAAKAAAEISKLAPAARNETIRGLILRAEVAKSELRLFLRSSAVEQLLGSTKAYHRHAAGEGSSDEHSYLVSATAHLITAHRDFNLPFGQQSRRGAVDHKLLNLIRRAAKAQDAVLRDRKTTIATHARTFELSPSAFSRLLRVNYLAPDIKAAIADGTQPGTLTVRTLLYSAMPLDWAQQRILFGFETEDGHPRQADLAISDG